MSERDPKIETAEADRTLASLVAGKPPSAQENAFFFGRTSELDFLGRDLRAVVAGQSAIRFLVGVQGSGKSALLGELLKRARHQRFVTMNVAFSRKCLLHGNDGEGRSLLEHALLSMRTLGSSAIGAMDAIIGGFRDRCEQIAMQSRRDLRRVQAEQLAPLHVLPRGHDFALAIGEYMDRLDHSDDPRLESYRRWLLARFDTTSEARAAVYLPYVSDADFWCMVKLWAKFIRMAGRSGLVLVLDELRLLPEVLTTPTRSANYAELFRIYDEMAQGLVSGVGLFIAATPSLFTDNESKGLCSEPGLMSCLQNGRAIGHSTDLVPNIAFELPELDYDAIREMLAALRGLLQEQCPTARLIPPSDIPAFMELAKDQLGGEEFSSVRDLIHRFVDVHNRLALNANLEWSDVLSGRSSGGRSVAAETAESGEFAERLF